MEYYFSVEASGYFPNLIEDVVGLVDERMQEGFIPWLTNVLYGKRYAEYLHFDLPIFFIAENDLGKVIPIYNWFVVTNRRIVPPRKRRLYPSIVFPKERYTRGSRIVPATMVQGATSYLSYFFPDSYVLEEEQSVRLPDAIQVPEPGGFDYKHKDVEEILRQIAENRDDFNPNSHRTFLPIEKSVSCDWVGKYYGYETPLRCIFIRIEKILSDPFLNGSASPESFGMNHVGTSCIILHEIFHAMVDEKMPKTVRTPMMFEYGCHKHVANLINYVMEESMANLFAYRSIRNRFIQKEDLRGVARFMDFQPFPYALGKRIGEAEKTLRSSLDLWFKQYLTKWYRAKTGHIPIADYRSWCRLILQNPPFTDVDVRQQIRSLFG